MSNEAVAILASIAGSGVIAAIITGIFSKRKVGAEATQIITDAASGIVVRMEAELDRQRKSNDEQRIKHEQAMSALVDSHREEVDEMRRVLQLHVAWDAIAIARLSEIGIELPPAPPLLPPTQAHHPWPRG